MTSYRKYLDPRLDADPCPWWGRWLVCVCTAALVIQIVTALTTPCTQVRPLRDVIIGRR